MRFNLRAVSAMTGLAAAAAIGLSVSPAQSATSAPPALAKVISQQVAPTFHRIEAPRAAVAPTRAVEVSEPTQVIVQPGDTLSSIAKTTCGHAGRWPNIWKKNRNRVKNPNEIKVGWKLSLPGCGKVSGRTRRAALDAVPAPPAPQPARIVTTSAPAQHYSCGDGDGDGYDIPCSQLDGGSARPAAQAPPVQQSASVTVSVSGMGSFQACVISRESGGNSQVMNASGHYGLYQFSASTWAGHGGNPADFGHASVAEQNAVFAATYAADGTSDWAPYDGC